MGPQHPATHGVLRVILRLDGEKVLGLECVIGYLHRGVEKIAENRTYTMFNPYVDRMDYVAAVSNGLGYCEAVEKLLSVEAPPRAQYIRVILTELNRIASHQLWLGTHALDIGAITPLFYTFRDREEILKIFEKYCGARLTTHAFRIGGLQYEAYDGFERDVKTFCSFVKPKIDEYEELLTTNRIWLERTKGVGVISGKDCIALGVTGPVLRASGVQWDIRKALPYANYKNFDFDIPTGENGDTYDRYIVRMIEMRQSLRIIEQAVEGIPEGPIMAKVPKVMKPPVGEIYHSIEAPKGELGYFIVSDGSTQPYRIRVRPPSFVNLQALDIMVPRTAGRRRNCRDRDAGYCSGRGGPVMHDFVQYVQSYLGSDKTPGGAGNFFWATVYVLLVFVGLSVAVIAMNWLERKILAHMQVRLGPMRVGPHGLLQPIADALKLLLKEDIIPDGADKVVFWIAPFIVVLAAFTVFVVVPFGPTHAITDMNIGILFMLGVSSLSVLGIVTAGWASNSHYPLIGALRSSAQMVSYEVAMGLAVVSAIMMTSLNATSTGTLSMIGIVEAQKDQHIWFLFNFFPLGIIAFGIFAIAMVAETNRAPFDLPEAESELTAGFHTEYSGFRWSLFFLAEYSAMIAVSSIAVTLWLGGWLRPFPNLLEGPTTDLVFSLVPGAAFLFLGAICFYNTARMPKHPLFKIQTIGLAGFGIVLALIGLVMLLPGVRERVQDIFWFSAKVAGFMYLYIWYRGTFPRYRFDQLMKVGWKVLLPTGLALLVLTAMVGMRAELVAQVKEVLHL